MNKRIIRYMSTFIIGNKVIEVGNRHRYHYQDITNIAADTYVFKNFIELRRAMNENKLPISTSGKSGISYIRKIPFLPVCYASISNYDQCVIITSKTFYKNSVYTSVLPLPVTPFNK